MFLHRTSPFAASVKSNGKTGVFSVWNVTFKNSII